MLWLMVALGGGLGAMGRYAITLAITPEAGKFPWATFCANVIGSFLMGALFVVIVQKGLLPIVWRHFLMVGFLGALTTFSTFSLDALILFQGGAYKIAIAYLVTSVCASILAALGGYILLTRLV